MSNYWFLEDIISGSTNNSGIHANKPYTYLNSQKTGVADIIDNHNPKSGM